MSDHIALVLYGSRGDIQPGVCLAVELAGRGHRVTAVVPPNLVAFARSAGLDSVAEIGLDTHTAWTSDRAKDVARDRNPLRRIRFALSTVRSGFAAFDDSMVDLFCAPDSPLADVGLLVVAPLCQARGAAVAERLGVPMVVLRYGPMSENGVIGALPGITDRWSARAKRRSWRWADRVTWWATGWSENAFRRRIELPRVHAPLPRRLDADAVPQIQAYDPALVPGLEMDWGPDDHSQARETAPKPIVGFFELSPESRAGVAVDAHTDGLEDWLASGDAPLFITFGSMPLPDPDEVVATVIAAARHAGFSRCLVSAGDRRGVCDDDPAVFFAGALDHAAVLPRCAAALHHGGAGTTAATLRAGLPTVVCAVTADQPFWAQRVTELGVGAGTRLTKRDDEKACAALTVAAQPATRYAAEMLAGRMIGPDKAIAVAADICAAQLE